MFDQIVAAAGGGVTAFFAKDGKPLWKLDDTGPVTPVLMGGVLYLPKAYDLRTGTAKMDRNPFTGEQFPADIVMSTGCSRFAASANPYGPLRLVGFLTTWPAAVVNTGIRTRGQVAGSTWCQGLRPGGGA